MLRGEAVDKDGATLSAAWPAPTCNNTKQKQKRRFLLLPTLRVNPQVQKLPGAMGKPHCQDFSGSGIARKILTVGPPHAATGPRKFLDLRIHSERGYGSRVRSCMTEFDSAS